MEDKIFKKKVGGSKISQSWERIENIFRFLKQEAKSGGDINWNNVQVQA